MPRPHSVTSISLQCPTCHAEVMLIAVVDHVANRQGLNLDRTL